MILLAQNRPQLTLMLNNLITYCNFTDMNINEKKSIYSYTNDHPQPPMTITTLTPMNKIKTLNFETYANFQNYKYLGIDINLNLNFSTTLKSTTEKYKKCINTICKKDI